MRTDADPGSGAPSRTRAPGVFIGDRAIGKPGRLGEVLFPAYDAIVKQIDCVCGHVVKGDDDDELWEQAQDHLRTDHPDLVGKVSREDILAQAEEI